MSLRSSVSQPWPGPVREALLSDTVRGLGGMGRSVPGEAPQPAEHPDVPGEEAGLGGVLGRPA